MRWLVHAYYRLLSPFASWGSFRQGSGPWFKDLLLWDVLPDDHSDHCADDHRNTIDCPDAIRFVPIIFFKDSKIKRKSSSQDTTSDLEFPN